MEEAILAPKLPSPPPAQAFNKIHQAGLDGRLIDGRGRGRGRGRPIHGRGRGGAMLHQDRQQKVNPFDMHQVHHSLPCISDPASSPIAKVEHRLSLQYLLPIELVATLDAAYPLEQPPRIELRSPWLTDNLIQIFLARLLPRTYAKSRQGG